MCQNSDLNYLGLWIPIQGQLNYMYTDRNKSEKNWKSLNLYQEPALC